MGKLQYLSKDLNSYNIRDKTAIRLSKNLSIKRSILNKIIQDHNIFQSNNKFFRNYKEIKEIDLMDLVLDIRHQYE